MFVLLFYVVVCCCAPPPRSQHGGTSTVLEVDERTTILEAALDNNIELPHDCKLGVCLTCPSLIVSGDVDQSEGTLDESVMSQVSVREQRVCAADTMSFFFKRYLF